MAPPLAEQIKKARTQKGPGSAAPKRPSRGGSGNQKRARERLARIRLADPKALPGVKPTARGNLKRADRYAILGAIRKLDEKKKADNYNPLTPLTGKAMNDETAAAERLEFGESDRALGEAFKAQGRQQDLVGNAYDQYRTAIGEATGRINAANAEAARQTQAAVDAAYTQDKAAQDQRDQAQAQRMQTFGLTAAPQTEGARAVEAQRSQGNLRAGDIRERGATDTTFMEGRGTTSIQAKAEALRREGTKREELEGKKRELAAQKGQFRNAHRAKLRSSEREWAAIQKEFGLKEQSLANEASADKASSAANVLVAKLYADANKAKARATIRVAKLQLEKGKIDQKQYREIVNIYRGLPEKGKPTPAKPTPKTGSGSGSGGKLAPWEVDHIDRSISGFQKNKYGKDDRLRAIEKATAAGIPKRLAERAWRKYVKSLTTPYDDRVRG